MLTQYGKAGTSLRIAKQMNAWRARLFSNSASSSAHRCTQTAARTLGRIENNTRPPVNRPALGPGRGKKVTQPVQRLRCVLRHGIISQIYPHAEARGLAIVTDIGPTLAVRAKAGIRQGCLIVGPCGPFQIAHCRIGKQGRTTGNARHHLPSVKALP